MTHTPDWIMLGRAIGQARDLRATEDLANRELGRAAAIIERLQRENATLKGRVGSLSLKLCQAEARAKRAERSAVRTH